MKDKYFELQKEIYRCDVKPDNLKKLIHLLAEYAFDKVHLDTLALGNSILEVIDAVSYEEFADFI